MSVDNSEPFLRYLRFDWVRRRQHRQLERLVSVLHTSLPVRREPQDLFAAVSCFVADRSGTTDVTNSDSLLR